MYPHWNWKYPKFKIIQRCNPDTCNSSQTYAKPPIEYPKVFSYAQNTLADDLATSSCINPLPNIQRVRFSGSIVDVSWFLHGLRPIPRRLAGLWISRRIKTFAGDSNLLHIQKNRLRSVWERYARAAPAHTHLRRLPACGWPRPSAVALSLRRIRVAIVRARVALVVRF